MVMTVKQILRTKILLNNDPEFYAGSSQTAMASMTNLTDESLDFTSELYFGAGKLASSGIIPFHLDAGETKSINYPIVMPSAIGTYPVFLDVFLNGLFIAHYQSTENVTVIISEVVQGRIGKWGYYTSCAYPEPHAETGLWPDHTLDFNYDLFPSTWYISVVGYNDSDSPVTAKLEIVDTNATIYHQADEKPIEAGDHESFSFSMGLPRVKGGYYFDAVLSFDGVVVDEGRWIINYDVEGVAAYSVTLGVSTTTPRVGEIVSWWADITNTGAVQGTPVIRWLRDGVLITSYETQPIEPGQTWRTYGSSFGLAAPGTYTLRVEVNGASDEVAIIVEEAEAKFEVTNLTISLSEVPVGEPILVTVTVTNVGSVAGTKTVTCEVTPPTVTITEVLPMVWVAVPLTLIDDFAFIMVMLMVTLMCNYIVKVM